MDLAATLAWRRRLHRCTDDAGLIIAIDVTALQRAKLASACVEVLEPHATAALVDDLHQMNLLSPRLGLLSRTPLGFDLLDGWIADQATADPSVPTWLEENPEPSTLRLDDASATTEGERQPIRLRWFATAPLDGLQEALKHGDLRDHAGFIFRASELCFQGSSETDLRTHLADGVVPLLQEAHGFLIDHGRPALLGARPSGLPGLSTPDEPG